MVLGTGSVGKTSLIRRLRKESFDPAQLSTCGIDAYHVEVLSWKPKGGAEDDDLSSGVAVQLREELKRQELLAKQLDAGLITSLDRDGGGVNQ